MMSETFESALSVRQGIEPPVSVNPYLSAVKRKKKKNYSVEEYVQGIVSGNRVLLSQAITLVESTNPDHFDKAQAIIEKCLPYSGESLRIGITGVPGVGKSTFIETFGNYLTASGNRIAVLAIDPSSERSKGSILGDKTRMESLATNEHAFIRPSPTGLTLGGVARKTRETAILCEAAGFNIILIETVGVGQSETTVKGMVDFFLLLMLSGAGDELQGIKRGIMEMADALVITKADGDNLAKANAAKAQYSSALRLFPHRENQWKVPVLCCSSLFNTGIPDIQNTILDFETITKKNGWFDKNRTQQLINILYDWMNFNLQSSFYHNPVIKNKIETLLPEIIQKKISPYEAGNQIMNLYFN